MEKDRCKKLTEKINSIIVKKRLVCFTNNLEEAKETYNLLNDKYKKKLAIYNIDYFLKHFNSKLQDDRNLMSREEFDSCVHKNYSNGNNYKQINRNTNSYDNRNPYYTVLYPMIFINGMNIGTPRNLMYMDYREELDFILN